MIVKDAQGREVFYAILLNHFYLQSLPSSVHHACACTANPLRHCKDEAAIIHVQPEAATGKLTVGVACERAIWLTSKVGLIKSASCITASGVASSSFEQMPLSYKPRLGL